MTCGVLFEKMDAEGPGPGWYYVHIPALGLTTHGQGVEGARAAAADLLQVWLEEKRAAGVAMHTKDVPTGTFRSILKQARSTEDEFKKL